jgi:putative hydrolase of the HAD superfamily
VIQALLCDFDGVIRLWPAGELEAVEDELGLARGAVLAAAFEPARLQRAVTGATPDEAWRAEVAAALGGAGRQAVAAWAALTGEIDAAMLALVQELRASLPVVLLTNATTRLRADLAGAGLTDAFDAVASSAELGVAKPDPEVYRRAAVLAGVEPQACVLVDDTLAHIEGAAAAGLTTVLHTDAQTTRGALVSLGAIPAQNRHRARRPGV